MVHSDLSYLRAARDYLEQKLGQKSQSACPSNHIDYAVTSLRPAVHPIRALPTELVALIFLHCLPERQELSPLTAPLLLTRICGEWRDIALHTPELWSSIFFELFTLSKSSLVSKMRMLEYWLAHGAAYPLTVYLHYRQPLAKAVPLLVAHAARWYDVDLFLHPTTLKAFSSAGAVQLPALRRLSLGCSKRPDATTARPLTAFRNAPALSEVELRTIAPSSIVLPWAQLTTFYYLGDDLADGMRVLALAPRLQSFTLDLLPAADRSSVLAPCIHGSLQALNVHTHPAAPLPVRDLLSALTLPALRTLELPPLGAADIDPLRAFIERSGCAVTSLAAPLVPLAEGALLRVFHALPALERLQLQYPAEAPLHDLLSALSFASSSEAGEPFLPRLSEVHLDCCRAAVPYPSLLAALQARWAPNPGVDVVRLRVFEMTVMISKTAPDPACLASLKALKAQGMRISVADVYQPSII